MERTTEPIDCGVCGKSLLISQSSRDLMAQVPTLVPVCPTCMQEGAELDEEPMPMIVPEATRDELVERTGLPREAIDDLIEYAKSLGPVEAARRVRQFHEKKRDS